MASNLFGGKNKIGQQVLRHAPIYFSSSMLVAGIGLMMNKYYTSVFQPSEFGILGLFLIVIQYTTLISGLRLETGVARLYFDYDKAERREYLTSILNFLVLFSIFISICAVSMLPFLKYFSIESYSNIFLISVLAGIAVSFVNFFSRIIVNLNESTRLSSYNLIQSTINHFCSFILISILFIGVEGRQLGQAYAYILTAGLMCYFLHRKGLVQFSATLNLTMVRQTLTLAVPSLLNGFVALILVYFDRIFLSYYHGQEVVGVYFLGFILGKALSGLVEAIYKAAFPSLVCSLDDEYEKARCEFERFALFYYGMLFLLGGIIIILSPQIVSLLSNELYSGASEVMPFIVATGVVGGYYKMPALMLNYHKKVWFYFYANVFVVPVSLILNFILVPSFSAVGAAYSTFLSIYIMSLLLFLRTKNWMTMKYNLTAALFYLITFILTSSLFAVYIY